MNGVVAKKLGPAQVKHFRVPKNKEIHMLCLIGDIVGLKEYHEVSHELQLLYVQWQIDCHSFYPLCRSE